MLTSLKLQDKDISILFVDDRRIQKLNKEYFGKDRPTNVISFSYLEAPPEGALPEGTGAPQEFPCELIGDIVISLDTAAAEAVRLGVPFYERLFALVIHGMLHVIGHDHVRDGNEARRMRYREKKLLTYVTSHRLYQELAL